MKKLVPLLALLIVALGLMYGLQWFASGPAHAPAKVAQSPVTEADLKGFQVYLQRQACRADCPEYAVMARGDGTVDFEGVRFTAVTGSRQATLDRDDLTALVRAVRKAQFFAIDDEYHPGGKKCEAHILDGKPLIVGATLHGKTQILHVDTGCSNLPAAITGLIADIDRITGTERWVTPKAAPAD